MVSSDLRTLVLRQSKTKEWSGSGLRNLVLSWLAAECNCKIRLASCTNERVPKVCPERFATRELRCLGKMAGTTRLELATSAVTEWKQQVLTTTYKASRDCQVLDNTQKPNESRAGVRVEDFTGSYRSRTSASRE